MMNGDYLRRGVAEFVGTFAFVLIGAGSLSAARTFTDIALAHGLAIGVMAAAFALISGAHFNPAVTLGFLVTRRIHPKLAAWYWLAQLGGGAVAALVLRWLLTGDQTHLGSPVLGSGVSSGKGVVLEAILTGFIVVVTFTTLVHRRVGFAQLAGLLIGLTYTLDILMGGAITGAAMNPARAFGPELVGHRWTHWWIWYLGPAAGAVIAAALCDLLFARSGASPEAPEPAADAAAA